MKNKKSAPKKPGRRYSLELSERQAQLVSQAVELMARLGMGQFSELDRFFWPEKKGGELGEAREHFQELCRIKNGAPHQYPGIHSESISDDYRVLFDLYQVVRHRLAWDREPNPPTPTHVHFRIPDQMSKVEGLATIQAASRRQEAAS